MSDQKPTSRRWLRFSAAGLLLFVFVMACVFAIVAGPQRQRRAVDAIRQRGGSVKRFFGDDTAAPIVDTKPDPLRTLLGEQFLRVDEVDLSGCTVTDSDLELLGTLKDIRVLHLDNTPITDKGLVHLAGLTQLEELSLQGAHITDEGLAILHDLPSIQILNLDDTRVTSESLSLLRELPRLKQAAILGLDLTRRDIADPQAVTRKLQFATRSNTVSDPQLLHDTIKAWKERKAATRVLSLTCVGQQTEWGVTFPIALELVVDSRGRVRLSEKGKRVRPSMKATIRDRVTVKVFDGTVRTDFHSKSDVGYPFAVIDKQSIDWWNYVRLSGIALAYRPLQDEHGGMIAENDLSLTRDIETIDGRQCMVLYHAGGRVWIDSSRNYLPIRYSTIRRGVTRSDDYLEYVKDEELGWVLSSWDTSLFDRNGQRTHRCEVTVDEHRVNGPIANTEFRLDFPAGTLIKDQIRNETYVLLNDGTRIRVDPGKYKGDYEKLQEEAP